MVHGRRGFSHRLNVKRLVIAHYRENLNWIQFVSPSWTPIVCTKGLRVYLDEGREGNTYLRWIIDNLAHIDPCEEIIFCQGNPFDHDKDFLKNLDSKSHFGFIEECAPDGRPRVDHCLLREYSAVLGLPVLDRYRFVAGAQFKVTGAQILKRSRRFYEAALALIRLRPIEYLLEPIETEHSFERLWNSIFDLGL